MKIPERLLPQTINLWAAARNHDQRRKDLLQHDDFKVIAAELRRQQPNLDDRSIFVLALCAASRHIRSLS